MGREWAARLAVIVILLGTGFLVGQQLANGAPVVAASPFRSWFWEARSLDLIVQALAVLVGALGLATLRTDDREDNG